MLLVLVVVAGAVAIPLALALGIFAAVRRDGRVDTITTYATLAVAAVPEFVVAVALVILLSTNIKHWLPASVILADGEHPWDQKKELVLPVLTLVIVVVPYITRFMRASMIEVLESDYVEMARVKGLPERVVILRHALPNAIVPALQAIALTLAYIAAGIVVVERIFGYPGMGHALLNAIEARDMPAVQTLGLVLAGLYVGLNLAADILTIVVTPRLRTALR